MSVHIVFSLVSTHWTRNTRHVLSITVWECASCWLDMAMNSSQTLRNDCFSSFVRMVCGSIGPFFLFWRRNASTFQNNQKNVGLYALAQYLQHFRELITWSEVISHWFWPTIQALFYTWHGIMLIYSGDIRTHCSCLNVPPCFMCLPKWEPGKWYKHARLKRSVNAAFLRIGLCKTDGSYMFSCWKTWQYRDSQWKQFVWRFMPWYQQMDRLLSSKRESHLSVASRDA